MNDFYTKWKNDNKYRTKIKLIAYVIFVVVVSIYAISLNKNSNEKINNTTNIKNDVIKNNNSNTINILEKYSYKININIDNNIYSYNGRIDQNEEYITKETNNEITNYRYFNNEYYVLIDNNYELTTKEEVYDIVNYNYINLNNINKYLSKAEKEGNRYRVYVKDIILDSLSDDYFVITINNNSINIDYTNLYKQYNSQIEKYIVDIQIEE